MCPAALGPEYPQLSVEHLLPNLAATRDLAHALARCAVVGDIFALRGDLGAGKTTFARFFLESLGIDEEVPSPTFPLVQTYIGSIAGKAVDIWHFDLYRIENAADALELGIEDAFEEAINLIEWPENLGPYLPPERLDIALSFQKADEARLAKITALGQSWVDRLGKLADPAYPKT